MRYGDLEFKTEPVGNFYGILDLPAVEVSEPKNVFERIFRQARSLALPEEKVEV